MQSAFFKLANVIPLDDAIKYMKKAVSKTYGSKGEDIVRMNNEAIDKGIDAIIKVKVPTSWKDAVEIADIKGAQEPDIIKKPVKGCKQA